MSYMFNNNDDEPPEPDETPYTDLFGLSHTVEWEHLIESADKIVRSLKRSGELSTNDASRLTVAPDHATSESRFETWFWTRVCPTVETHPNVRWNDCYKFDPDNALTDEEYEEIASGFNINASETTRGPKRYYPRVINGFYGQIRNQYESSKPRNGVSKEELLRDSMNMRESDLERCLDYLERFPDIIVPSYQSNDDRPDWEWVDDLEES